jgi:hypothetical protein
MDLPDGSSIAEYEALPEEICRRMEAVDGAIVVSAAPPRLPAAEPASGHRDL